MNTVGIPWNHQDFGICCSFNSFVWRVWSPWFWNFRLIALQLISLRIFKFLYIKKKRCLAEIWGIGESENSQGEDKNLHWWLRRKMQFWEGEEQDAWRRKGLIPITQVCLHSDIFWLSDYCSNIRLTHHLF